MARHAALFADDPITMPIPIPIPAPPVVIARPRWPITALILTLLAGIVITAGGTLLTVQLLHPAAVATPAASTPALATTNPAPSPAPAAPSTQPSADTPATPPAASSTSSGSDDAPIPGPLRVGGPSPTGWTDGNGNPTSDPFQELCDGPHAPDYPGSYTTCTNPDAAPALTGTDQQFLGELKSRGIVTPGTMTELHGAATVCQHLTSGSTLTREADKLMDAPYHYSAALAGYFAGQAVRDYCPSFSNQLK